MLLEIDKENVSKAERIFEKIQKRLLVEYPYIFCVSRAYNDALLNGSGMFMEVQALQ